MLKGGLRCPKEQQWLETTIFLATYLLLRFPHILVSPSLRVEEGG